jgi:hypothetical protein
MLTLLLTLWVATLGADRIDFLGGYGGFTLTPFLVLSPVICAVVAGKALMGQFRGWRMPESPKLFLISFYGLLYLFFLSVIFGPDPVLGIKRLILLGMQLVFGWVVVLALKRPTALVMGSFLGLLLHGIFCVFEMANWVQGKFLDPAIFQPFFINTLAHTVGHYAPRLSGASMDPNRGGLLLMFYAFCLLRFQPPWVLRPAILVILTLFVVITLSKTAIFSLLVVLGVVAWQQRHSLAMLRARNLGKLMLSLVALLALQPILSVLFQVGPQIDVERMLSERLSATEETSGGIHLELIVRGIATLIESPKNVLVGSGFGTAYTLLDDLFPDSKYANFHSIYISFLAETGVFSLILFGILGFYPMRFSRGYTPLLLGLGTFNLFYQLTFEPVFWFALLLSWYNAGFEQRPHTNGKHLPQALPVA